MLGWLVSNVTTVDGASGGFVAPFATPQLEWDFKLPRVVSINTSGHKFGLAYVGVGAFFYPSQASSFLLTLTGICAADSRRSREPWTTVESDQDQEVNCFSSDSITARPESGHRARTNT